LLETLRHYADEKLDEAGESTTVRDRHLAWFLALAQTASIALREPGGLAWLDRLEVEHDNLRAALTWSLTRGDGEVALRLAAALPRFWELRGHISEGRQWLARALGAGESAAAEMRAAALLGAGTLAYLQGDLIAARTLSEESLFLNQQIGNRQGTAETQHRLGSVAFRRGEYAAARACLEASLKTHGELGQTMGIAGVHSALGMLAFRQGEYDAARAHFESCLTLYRQIGDKDGMATALDDLATVAGELGTGAEQSALLEESLALYREIGKRQGIALVLGTLGMTAWGHGDLTRAMALMEESLALYRAVGDRRGIARLLAQQGLVALYQRDATRATALCRDSLILFREVGDLWEIARYLPVLAGAAFAQGQSERAARLFGTAAKLRDHLGTHLPPAVQPGHDRTVAAVRAALGNDAFERGWQTGWSMSEETAVAYAIEEAKTS
jgi:tetratricopeptide (TPR) repeat protein